MNDTSRARAVVKYTNVYKDQSQHPSLSDNSTLCGRDTAIDVFPSNTPVVTHGSSLLGDILLFAHISLLCF